MYNTRILRTQAHALIIVMASKAQITLLTKSSCALFNKCLEKTYYANSHWEENRYARSSLPIMIDSYYLTVMSACIKYFLCTSHSSKILYIVLILTTILYSRRRQEIEAQRGYDHPQ